MFPILYEKNETNFLHNGIGVLSDCISATATEERNGIFELEIEYDSDGQFADVIENDMIIKAKANDKQDPQLFRIYTVNKSQENDNLKISAQHITYDLAGNFVEKLELNNVTAAAAMEAIQNNLAYPTKFTISSTNTTTVSSTKLYRTNPLQMIGGIDGSIIDNWGGEIERDNFRLILHAHRGSDNGVLVAYKKNLTGLEAKFDTSEVVTRIFPFKVLEDGTVITIPGKFIDSPLINNYPFIRILPIDASEDEDVTDQASLYAAYKNYFNSGAHDKPMVTLEVEFEPLWATEEYEDVAALELIGMGDTITVRNEKMGVDVTAEATKIEYDVLNEKNAKVTAGSIQTRLTDAVNGATSTVAQGIQQAIQAANTALTAANGKNKIFYGPDEPADANKDDVWFKVVDGEYTRTYRFDGIQWQLVVDADVSAADQAAQAAQAAAEEAKATAANAEAVGQAAQQTAADAEAKGDAAAKVAEEAKDAATKAQADAASAVTSANNAVSTANQATQDAQDAIDKAQDGFDAAQDALSKAGAAVDTANTAKQVASDAATQASTAKTNAQTAMSNAQDAISQAKAANDNANTREKSIIKSNTAPANPPIDQLWVDTSKTPQIMRRWNGTAWVDLSPTQASQIGAVSTTTYTTDITNINNTLSQKASATTVNTLTGRVDKAETAISQNASDIALKADKNVVDTLKNTVDNHSTLISQNADAIALKASQSSVDSLTGRVSTAEATLKTQADQIEARITKTDADAKYATQTSLTATANSLTSSITAVQTNLDNLSIGARNYVLNSTLDNGSNWSFRNGATVDSSMLYNNHKTIKFYSSGLSSDAWAFAKPPLRDAKAGEIYSAGAWFNLKSNTITSDDGAYLVIEFYDSSKTRIAYWNIQADKTVLDKWQYVKSENRTAPTNTAYVTVTPFSKRNGTFWVADMTLNKSTKVSDWSPAPEDMATVVQFNTLSQTLDSTTSRIGNAEGNISALQQTANSFATRISNAEGNISTLTQTAKGLQSTVNGKVDTTTYNSFVTQTNTALQSKLSIQDAANTYATQSSLTQTANSLTSKITSVQTNLDNLQIGGRNFLLGTSTPQTVKGTGGTNERTTIYYLSTDFSSLVGKQLTISFDLIADTTSGTVTVQWNDTPWGNINFGAPSTTLKHYTRTFTLSDSGTATGIEIRLDNVTGNVTVSNFMLEISSKPSSWQPAPEDMATQSQISQLSDDINLRVQKGDVINQINVSTEGILIDGKKVHITGQTTIDNAVIKDAMIDSISANKLTAGTIDANVITVKNINASNIVTGTLDASKATVTNIDASKITTGTLNAARIAAGSIDASKLAAGTITAASGVIGSLDASKITTGTLDAAKVSVVNLNASNIKTGTLSAVGIHQSNTGQDIWLDTNGFHAQMGDLNVWMSASHGFEVLYGSNSIFKVNGDGPFHHVELTGYMANQEDMEDVIEYMDLGSDELRFRTFNKSTNNFDLSTHVGSGFLSIFDSSIGKIYFSSDGCEIDQGIPFKVGNIKLNGYHSIISLDGGGLYFSDQNDSRIDINIATLYYTGSLKKSSSETIKANIEPINFSALDEIMKTDFYSYNYKTDLEKGITKPSYGVVIGDKYRLSDKFLTQDAQAVSIDNMTAINSQAIKEIYEAMQKQNQQIVLKIADLELELANLKQKLGGCITCK